MVVGGEIFSVLSLREPSDVIPEDHTCKLVVFIVGQRPLSVDTVHDTGENVFFQPRHELIDALLCKRVIAERKQRVGRQIAHNSRYLCGFLCVLVVDVIYHTLIESETAQVLAVILILLILLLCHRLS